MSNKAEAGVVSREDLVKLLNDDLSREYQAIIAYVNYSQVLKGAQYMNIAAKLETHAGEELAHALIIAKQIDYLGGMPTVTPKPVKTSTKRRRHAALRPGQRKSKPSATIATASASADALGEFALAEHIREILIRSRNTPSISRLRWALMSPTPASGFKSRSERLRSDPTRFSVCLTARRR